MFTFVVGLFVGVFMPVQYNVWIKNKIYAAWDWVKSGPTTP